MSSKVWIQKLSVGQTVAGAGNAWVDFRPAKRKFQAILTGTGTISATVLIECSLDGTNFLTLGTITLNSTNTATDGFAGAEPWPYTRSNVTSIQGTDATVTILAGS